jgi:ubiquinone/menaquinone biosynthesis C-methylase UbiE
VAAEDREGSSEAAWAERLAGGAQFTMPLGRGPGMALQGFWRELFASVPPDTSLLEIGCGAGHVSLWAAETGRGFRIVASDMHAHPGSVLRHPSISFVGGARAEALPFASASFDLVVSNFGIEYGRPDKVYPELIRVLAPQANAALVLHSADSAVTANSRFALEHFGRFEATGIPEQLRRAAALRADHLSRRKLLKEALRRRAEMPAQQPATSYFAIADRLLKGEPSARRDLEALDGEVALRLALYRDQLRVALDGPTLQSLCSWFSSQGLEVMVRDLNCFYDNAPTEKVGWILLLAKTAPPG